MTPAVVFLGPTLTHEEGRAVLDAQYLPPAAHGDVLQAARRGPRVIAIVDGVFERQPAVWHKEILFALSEGIHVYGAASMGALRAAELDTFGMRGIGEVYRAYADGTLEDDDEVTVAHADADHAFRAVSDAMVDVRATLDSAVANAIVGDETAAEIVARVKETFYAQRLLVGALDRNNAEHERLRAWLPQGWVRRKRDDALDLLRTIAHDVETGLEPFRPAWTLQRTRAWEDARRSVELAAEDRPLPTPAWVADEELEAVLDEVRLDPDRYRLLLDRSLLSALAGAAASAVGIDASPWAHQAALDHERLQRGLLQPDGVDDWLSEQDLTDADLPAVARRLAVMRWAHHAHRGPALGELALTLRADDAYAGLAERAARKRDTLSRIPSTDDVDDTEIVVWYFRERLGREVPAALDAWASAHGWRQATELIRALRAEWLFERAPDVSATRSR